MRLTVDCSCLLLELRVEADDLVVVAASHAEDEPLLGVAVKFEGRESSVEALQEGRSIVVEDIAWGVRIDAATRKRLLFRSALFVPIRADDALIGSLLLYSTERRDSYSSQDVARAEMVAEQAASAICNARLYHDLELSQQRSRRCCAGSPRSVSRSARSGRTSCTTTSSRPWSPPSTRSRACRRSCRSRRRATPSGSRPAAAAIDDTRRVIRDLRPPALDGVGLRGALQSLVEQADGGACDGDASSSATVPELSTAVETACISSPARRSTTPCATPARGTSGCGSGAATTAPDTGEVVRLQVRDDGRGLRPASRSATATSA